MALVITPMSQHAFSEAERCHSSNAMKSIQLFHVYGDLLALSLYETRLQGIMVVVFIKLSSGHLGPRWRAT